MELLKRGDIVSAQFIFTDASQTKIRPAVVIAVLTDDNFLMCPITTRERRRDPVVARLPDRPAACAGASRVIVAPGVSGRARARHGSPLH